MEKKYKVKLSVNTFGVLDEDKIYKFKVYAVSVDQAIYYARKEIMEYVKYPVGYKEIEILSIKRVK